MKIHLAAATVAVMTLAGCGSTANFTKGMEGPVKALNSAATVAQESERDVLKSLATGLMVPFEPFNEAKFLACGVAGNGPDSVRADLQAFADGLEAVKEVGAKPDDTSYAGYLHKLRQNAAAGINTTTEATASDALEEKEMKRRRECFALWDADVAVKTALQRPQGDGAPPQFIARLLGLDQLFKQVLAKAEEASREAAVRRTIEALTKDLEKAATTLKAPPGGSYGPYVHYDPTSAPLAHGYNATALGASVNIRRWYVAQQVRYQYEFLKACRTAATKQCFGDPAVQTAANGFADAVYAYRRLAQVDPAKIHKAVDSAVTASKNSLKVQGIAGWIDGLIGVADSLKDLDSSIETYQDSRK